MSVNITVIKEVFNEYSPNFIMAGFELANRGTNQLFGTLLCVLIFVISMIAQRENQGEVMRTISTSLFFTTIVATILLSMGQIIEAHAYIVGILLVISVLVQKASDN